MIYRRKSFFEYLREASIGEWIAGALVAFGPFIMIWLFFLLTGKPVQF